MINPHGLEQGPETVADVQCQNRHACCIQVGIKRSGQDSVDGIGNRYTMFNKMDIKEMHENKSKDRRPGVGHSPGSQGSAAGGFADRVTVRTGLQILQEQGDAGDDVEQKNGKQNYFCNRNQRSKGVQMFCIGEKGASAPEYGAVACRMHKQESA